MKTNHDMMNRTVNLHEGMPFYNMRFTVVLGGCKIHCTNDS